MTRLQVQSRSMAAREMVQNNSCSKAKISSVTQLFHIFLERILSDALEEHDGNVNIGGRNTTNLRFVDGIDALAERARTRGPI